jgi:ribosome-binding protein aMBF1 (putative translation factor)
MNLRHRIALTLMRARESAGLSRRELAKKLGCHPNTIQRIETANGTADIWQDAWLDACNAKILVVLEDLDEVHVTAQRAANELRCMAKRIERIAMIAKTQE